jgi:hypothetical protein
MLMMKKKSRLMSIVTRLVMMMIMSAEASENYTIEYRQTEPDIVEH